ncbi:DUF3139 domain-containing protein [Rossellomorea vietnamensis]|uniref:DUF3139 domain-containing protein n=1 Tax=Rossellomorea vietnamensis TaxID=218284 RepID=A0A5D4KCL3_9BACI|nr:DUF3139 domain-containing protein [Rossellomorea vietnamensis]TYR74490.1 DUF3139 domain-containing protein [Rossellomorea vietnamensis]
MKNMDSAFYIPIERCFVKPAAALFSSKGLVEEFLEEITIKGILKDCFYFAGCLFIIQLVISLWTGKGIDWLTFFALSIGGLIGIVIRNEFKNDSSEKPMKKWSIAASTVLILVAGGIFFFKTYQQNVIIEDTYSYLQEQGYGELIEKEEITTYPRVSIDEDGDPRFSGGYFSFVTFEDEPLVEYVFGYKEETKQITMIDFRQKSSEPPLKEF